MSRRRENFSPLLANVSNLLMSARSTKSSNSLGGSGLLGPFLHRCAFVAESSDEGVVPFRKKNLVAE